MEKYSFPPLIDKKTETIILGTIPGEDSLRKVEYYANKTNQFWWIIFKIFNDGINLNDYNLKTKLLLDNKIGLWDVLKRAEREGSLDENIKQNEINDFQFFFTLYPRINKVIFNGQNAANYFATFNFIDLGINFIILPSTSSAKTWKTFDQKLIDWRNALI